MSHLAECFHLIPPGKEKASMGVGNQSNNPPLKRQKVLVKQSVGGHIPKIMVCKTEQKTMAVNGVFIPFIIAEFVERKTK